MFYQIGSGQKFGSFNKCRIARLYFAVKLYEGRKNGKAEKTEMCLYQVKMQLGSQEQGYSNIMESSRRSQYGRMQTETRLLKRTKISNGINCLKMSKTTSVGHEKGRSLLPEFN